MEVIALTVIFLLGAGIAFCIGVLAHLALGGIDIDSMPDILGTGAAAVLLWLAIFMRVFT